MTHLQIAASLIGEVNAIAKVVKISVGTAKN
jgi:hypothetical protein